MARLIGLRMAAAFAVASATAFAQGAGTPTHAPKATPAAPAMLAPAAKANDTKKSTKKKTKQPTKAQEGEPKGEARGQANEVSRRTTAAGRKPAPVSFLVRAANGRAGVSYSTITGSYFSGDSGLALKKKVVKAAYPRPGDPSISASLRGRCCS
ncbi:MAG TPA: hypothetical protein VLC47_08770 [Burkholderiales bacterium]|nr:hypothetical protein [Burkholderiales bacterium]